MGSVMDKTVVDLSKFGLRMAGNSVAATFYATNLVSDPVFRASADGRVDLGAVKEVYPLEKGVDLGGLITADLKLSGRMSDIEKNRYERLGAQGTFVVEGVGLTLPNLPAVRIRRAAATVTPSSASLWIRILHSEALTPSLHAATADRSQTFPVPVVFRTNSDSGKSPGLSLIHI